MSEIELKIRRMKTGETLIACFESEEDARTWLRDRPEFVDVLGTADPNIDPEVAHRLKAALRPFDAKEKAFLEQDKQRIFEEAKARQEAEMARAVQQREAHRQQMQNIGEQVPMALRWTIDLGLTKADPDDPREITDASRDAVEAWLAERRTWVSAPKVICEASFIVWPGTVPSGNEEDRIHPGARFQTGFSEE